MKWHGPFNYRFTPDGDYSKIFVDWSECPFNIEYMKGVYFLAVETDLGLAVNYVGTADGKNGFKGRLDTDRDSHKSCYLDGRYMLEDPKLMKQGVRKPINYGLLNLELNMAGTLPIQKEKLPSDLVVNIEKIQKFGVRNRSAVHQMLKNDDSYKEIKENEAGCLKEWESKLFAGKSIRTAPKEFSKEIKFSWNKLNKLLRKYYLLCFFDNLNGRSIGAEMLRQFKIYCFPNENKDQNLKIEGLIFQTICNHPTQWVREFIQYGVSQPLVCGSQVDLEVLETEYGLGYGSSPENWGLTVITA